MEIHEESVKGLAGTGHWFSVDGTGLLSGDTWDTDWVGFFVGVDCQVIDGLAANQLVDAIVVEVA